ncbi:MAG: murein L,D-transpeptidase [Sporomusaceae bacterium]|nr:murein L,D-transpeptidase [Sporomusaceae bacterium]
MIRRLVTCIAILLLSFLPTAFTASSDNTTNTLDSTSLSNQQAAAGFLESILRDTHDYGNQLAAISQADAIKVQSMLEILGYHCGGVDGIIGPNTKRAIKAFQKDRGVVQVSANAEKNSAYSEIRINIPEFILSLIEKGKVSRQFDIAVGTSYEQTPTGTFHLFSKIENPTWFPGSNFFDQSPVPPGPDNPLGTRWMEFTQNYGIHGTNKDWDISYPVSGGCIRMHDVEARQLYEMVGIGTPVVIVYETMKIIEKSDGLYLKVFPDIYRKKTSTQENFLQLFEPFAAAGYKILPNPTDFLKEVDEISETKIAVKSNIAPIGKVKKE